MKPHTKLAGALVALGAMTALSACSSLGGSESAATAGTTSISADAFAAAAPAASGGQCAMTIAGGPPPKPAKGADFAQNAVAKNVGRNVSRNVIANIGGRFGGGLGAAVAGGLARNTIRTEQDLKGSWTITDGAPDCGCRIDISSGVNLAGQSSNAGALEPSGCTSLVSNAARWQLGGRSFTGYDTTLKLLASDRRTVVATLNRDGINYFSGSLADGTPVTLWRRGG
ncbi:MULTISPECIES: hypothetical protein [unclassified Roseitalea]|uniref:hypothetical protein n=1 Tax=unclassified Roseitalea TaxID=2639107 RepID=UPI00273EA68F|nr:MULTISPECIES: hypothetical protein [unclassified Roseitalea]